MRPWRTQNGHGVGAAEGGSKRNPSNDQKKEEKDQNKEEQDQNRPEQRRTNQNKTRIDPNQGVVGVVVVDSSRSSRVSQWPGMLQGPSTPGGPGIPLESAP